MDVLKKSYKESQDGDFKKVMYIIYNISHKILSKSFPCFINFYYKKMEKQNNKIFLFFNLFNFISI